MPDPPAVSATGRTLYDQLGPLTSGDAAASAGPGLGWPLLRLCDALVQGLAGVDQLARDTAAGPGWSAILDPARCPTAALPWLGQLVGVRVDTAATDAAQRAQILAESGWARGTPDSVIAAARRYLSGNQAIRLIERDYNDPYLLTVVVFGQQVAQQSYSDISRQYRTYADLTAQAGATYADFSAGLDELMLALQAAVPAGLVINLLVSAGQLYSDLTAGAWGASYSATSAHYATYRSMTTAPPGT